MPDTERQHIGDLPIAVNVSDAGLRANIAANLKTDFPVINEVPAHDRHAVLVGGGPSLADCLDDLKYRRGEGQDFFALNGAARFLALHGIATDYGVILDARPENAMFVDPTTPRWLLASQVSPNVVEAAAPRVALWHALTPETEELAVGQCALIGGGLTVGLSAMCLAFTLGYRKLHLYGYDSSRRSWSHAYPQPLNAADEVFEVECAGRTFVTSRAMAWQAYSFQKVAFELAQLDCLITVHGDGLLPHLARTAFQLQPLEGEQCSQAM